MHIDTRTYLVAWRGTAGMAWHGILALHCGTRYGHLTLALALAMCAKRVPQRKPETDQQYKYPMATGLYSPSECVYSRCCLFDEL